ncbi:MBL fold metallo-hydrolase [Salinibius halmophilus]|uniref:MBL fold metallo-hydrolase n=1 Tax=Salinibius halmophilus TaxID=1853216 RepID=UPI000E65F869|nr:MBL fold metallo-hydrolase [Salinibius halmophilus]
MNIQHFYDPNTFTLTYVVYDEATRDTIVIDPVLDFDQQGAKITNESYLKVKDFISEHDLTVRLVLETHAHADHLSGAPLFKADYPDALVGIGEHITQVQQVFKGVYNLGDEVAEDGSQFDLLLKDGETVTAGSLTLKVIHTPGHTPACASYLIDDAVFTGDALFMPDYGTGRCDFPRGDADALYTSVHEKLYGLPDETRVFTGHDYQPGGRELAFESTIGENKRNNVQLKMDTSREQYVQFRRERDATLKAPKLLYPSIQVNIQAGHLPAPEANGRQYLKTPLNVAMQTS